MHGDKLTGIVGPGASTKGRFALAEDEPLSCLWKDPDLKVLEAQMPPRPQMMMGYLRTSGAPESPPEAAAVFFSPG